VAVSRWARASVTLRDTVRELLSKGRKKILLNLEKSITSTAQALVNWLARLPQCATREAKLKLLNLTKKVHDLLQITKLYTVFDVKDDEAAAVKSFN